MKNTNASQLVKLFLNTTEAVADKFAEWLTDGSWDSELWGEVDGEQQVNITIFGYAEYYPSTFWEPSYIEEEDFLDDDFCVQLINELIPKFKNETGIEDEIELVKVNCGEIEFDPEDYY